MFCEWYSKSSNQRERSYLTSLRGAWTQTFHCQVYIIPNDNTSLYRESIYIYYREVLYLPVMPVTLGESAPPATDSSLGLAEKKSWKRG